MNIGEYIVDCPDCRRCRMRIRDVPSVSYINAYLPQPTREEPEDDRWRYAWVERCLWCSYGTDDRYELPEGARALPFESRGDHLADELRRFHEAGGSNPAVESEWREELASVNGVRGDLAAAFDQLGHAMDLVSHGDPAWWRIAMTFAAHARTDEHRTIALARFEQVIATTEPGIELAALLLQLAGLHAGLRDFHAAWGAAEHALSIYRDADAEHRGFGIAAAAYELIAIGAMLGVDTTTHEAMLREQWEPVYGAQLAAMISSKKSHYR